MGIIIAGMRRSGSTVAYQIALELMGGRAHGFIPNPKLGELWLAENEAAKTHRYWKAPDHSVLATVRDPRDIAVSIMNVSRRTFDTVMDQGFIKSAIHEQWLWENNRPDLRVIKYEDFYNNLHNLIYAVAHVAGKPVTSLKVTRMAEDYSLDKNRERADRAYNMRPDLLFPGHIQHGGTGQWKGKLDDDQLSRIYDVAGIWMEANGYV